MWWRSKQPQFCSLSHRVDFTWARHQDPVYMFSMETRISALQDALILSYHSLASDDWTFLCWSACLFPFVYVTVFPVCVKFSRRRQLSPAPMALLLSVLTPFIFLCLSFFFNPFVYCSPSPLFTASWVWLVSILRSRSDLLYSACSWTLSHRGLEKTKRRNIWVVEMFAFFGLT